MEEGEADLVLRDLSPSYVIMVDSSPSFIRSLEIYSNGMYNVPKEDRLRVFFLLYEHSAELHNFIHTLDREKEAFDRLIDHKKRMPRSLPSFNNFSTQEMQQARGGFGGSYAGGSLVSFSCFVKV